MGRIRVPSVFFVFVVVEHDGHVLLIRERKHGQLWYCPAGGLEPPETVDEAAIRETWEEAGVLIEPTRVLRIEQQWSDAGGWWRFVLHARPSDPRAIEPKRFADEHSLEARWVRPADLSRFALRHPEVVEIVKLAS
jgi:8-oxo-dGTP pyrophosphatase MutT (NUDIX family)